MPRQKTGSALTAAQKQARYRERKSQRKQQLETADTLLNSIALYLRAMEGEKIVIRVADTSGENIEIVSRFLHEMQFAAQTCALGEMDKALERIKGKAGNVTVKQRPAARKAAKK